MKRSLNIVLAVGLFIALMSPACAVDTENEGPLPGASESAEESVVESTSLPLMDIDNDSIGTCKADCFDECTSLGASSSECSKSCKKACTGAGCNGNNWAACSAGSNSSSNAICKFMNKRWESTCKASGVLKAFCFPFGGCSSCRSKMDQNC